MASPVLTMNRRSLLGAAVLMLVGSVKGWGHEVKSERSKTLPIEGSWFDFRHPNPYDGNYWNMQTAAFTGEQWQAKIREMAGIGMKTLVLMSVAHQGMALYPSRVIPRRWRPFNCEDPIEAVLQAADREDARVFIGLGFFEADTGRFDTRDPVALRYSRDVPVELWERYGHHTSFGGWYLPVEAPIRSHFPDGYLRYTQAMASRLRQIAPGKPILIAPYGTRTVMPDARFVSQLRALEVDHVAYQDEVGVEKTRLDELDGIWSRVRQAHDRAGIPLWADVELFRFEGPVYRSPLVPAPLARIEAQLAAASRYVEKILGYQYLGLMNAPDSLAPAGHPSSVDLYRAYRAWLECRTGAES